MLNWVAMNDAAEYSNGTNSEHVLFPNSSAFVTMHAVGTGVDICE